MSLPGVKANGALRRAGSASRAHYRRRGQAIVQRAGIPSSCGAAEAAARLVADAEARGGGQEVIAANTLRVYRRYYTSAARDIGEMVPGVDVEALIGRVDDALEARRGKPDPSRTSASKIKDPSACEVHAICAALKTRILKRGDRLDLALLLYLVVAPRIGWRPVEMTSAWINGDTLYLRSAKRRGAGAPVVRTRSLKQFAPVLKEALWILLALVPRGLDDQQFELWRNRLAGRLAHLSARLRRRLSLYFARHIGIATWKKAGLDPATIARLAGHVSLDAHQEHYARAAAGFERDVHLVDNADIGVVPSPSDLDLARQQQSAKTFEKIRMSMEGRFAAGDYDTAVMRRELAGLHGPGETCGVGVGHPSKQGAVMVKGQCPVPAREITGRPGEGPQQRGGGLNRGLAPKAQGQPSARMPEPSAEPPPFDDPGPSLENDSENANPGSSDDSPAGPSRI